MEKMIWAKPELNEVAFAANEYVAACGDSGANYFFKCDAGSKYKDYFVYVDVYNDDDTTNDFAWLTAVSGWDWYTGREGHDSTYSPCGTTHEASTDDDFIYGYMYEAKKNGRNWQNSGDRIDVIIWGGQNNQNTHCTTNLDITTWETDKS